MRKRLTFALIGAAAAALAVAGVALSTTLSAPDGRHTRSNRGTPTSSRLMVTSEKSVDPVARRGYPERVPGPLCAPAAPAGTVETPARRNRER